MPIESECRGVTASCYEWLMGLQVGDPVQVKGGWGQTATKVERITKTQIVTTNGRRFRRANGLLVGGDKWRTRIKPPMSKARKAGR